MGSLKKNIFYCILLCLPFVLMAAHLVVPPIKIGDKAPEFTLFKLNGDSVSLSDYKGKVVVVHIWSHTCPHCRMMNQTLPGIVNPYKKSNFAYVMIDIDTDTSGWRKIIKEDKLNFAIHAIDPHDGSAKTMIDYDGKGTPCVNVVNEKGNLEVVNITTDVQLKKFLKKRFPGVK